MGEHVTCEVMLRRLCNLGAARCSHFLGGASPPAPSRPTRPEAPGHPVCRAPRVERSIGRTGEGCQGGKCGGRPRAVCWTGRCFPWCLLPCFGPCARPRHSLALRPEPAAVLHEKACGVACGIASRCAASPARLATLTAARRAHGVGQGGRTRLAPCCSWQGSVRCVPYNGRSGLDDRPR
jgi:hypothetical protein